jgi:shikimate 5-dehydrogenase
MAEVYYGIAGKPVSHSISPLLVSIVSQHLEQNSNVNYNLEIKSLNLIEADSIQDALAWGYAKTIPNPVNWDYTGAPFGKFRNRALIQKALEITAKVDEEDEHLLFGQKFVEPAKFPIASKVKLPTRAFGEEIWLNLTTPLKHQLTSQAVVDFNESSSIESVNVLRWDGHGWWSSNVDGCGVVRCAEFFGLDVSSGATLAIVGGGGAARSTAFAWAKSGGKIKIIAGRRTIDEGPWSESIVETESYDMIINFDSDDVPESIDDSTIIISPRYELMDGSVEQRMQNLLKGTLDGRWMLVAQHLECWRQLWAPHCIDDLPSMGLLMTKLIHAENVLASYA